jgi:hypothetical protein
MEMSGLLSQIVSNMAFTAETPVQASIQEAWTMYLGLPVLCQRSCTSSTLFGACITGSFSLDIAEKKGLKRLCEPGR